MGEVPQVRTVLGDLALSQGASSKLGVDFQTTGSGAPVTCFVPGLGQTIADTRPFGSGVLGSKVFVNLLDGGKSTADIDNAARWSYERFAEGLAEVVKATAATRAVGVSLGAGMLLSLVVQRHDELERMVLALPPALAGQPPDEIVALASQLADAIEANEQIELARLLLAMQPPAARGRTDVRVWARRHAALLGGSGIAQAFRLLPGAARWVTTEQLNLIDAPVLVLAQRGDPWHPVSAAEQLASGLPNAQVVVSDVPWVWAARSELRAVITDFLNF